MVKPGGEESSLELEAAQEYFGMAHSIWIEAQRALERAEEERNKALTFLHKVERRLEVIDIDQEENNPPSDVASKKSPSPTSATTTTTSQEVVLEEPRVRKLPRRQPENHTYNADTESEDDDDDEETYVESHSVAAAASPIIRTMYDHWKNDRASTSSTSNNNQKSSISSSIDWITIFNFSLSQV
jgi:type IV secretory pathway VirB10-like protein